MSVSWFRAGGVTEPESLDFVLILTGMAVHLDRLVMVLPCHLDIVSDGQGVASIPVYGYG
jgi:hypothetical protein